MQVNGGRHHEHIRSMKRIESTIDTAIDCDEDEVMELAMQAGELLLENGAEIFRDGMKPWIASADITVLNRPVSLF